MEKHRVFESVGPTRVALEKFTGQKNGIGKIVIPWAELQGI